METEEDRSRAKKILEHCLKTVKPALSKDTGAYAHFFQLQLATLQCYNVAQQFLYMYMKTYSEQ